MATMPRDPSLRQPGYGLRLPLRACGTWASAKPAGGSFRALRGHFQSAGRQDAVLQPADLLGARERCARAELLSSLSRAGAAGLATREESHCGEAQDAANAAESAFPLQYAARDLRIDAQ